MRERAVESALREAARAAGGACWKLTSRRGAPDRLLILPGGRVALVETKAPGGRLSAVQRHVLDHLSVLGHRAYVVSTPGEARALVGEVLHA